MYSIKDVKKIFREKVIESPSYLTKLVGLFETAVKIIIALLVLVFDIVFDNSAYTLAEKYLKDRNHLIYLIHNHPTDEYKKQVSNEISKLKSKLGNKEGELSLEDNKSGYKKHMIYDEMDKIKKEIHKLRHKLKTGDDPDFLRDCQKKLNSILNKKENIITKLNDDIPKLESGISELEQEYQSLNTQDKNGRRGKGIQKEIGNLNKIMDKEKLFLQEVINS